MCLQFQCTLIRLCLSPYNNTYIDIPYLIQLPHEPLSYSLYRGLYLCICRYILYTYHLYICKSVSIITCSSHQSHLISIFDFIYEHRPPSFYRVPLGSTLLSSTRARHFFVSCSAHRGHLLDPFSNTKYGLHFKKDGVQQIILRYRKHAFV